MCVFDPDWSSQTLAPHLSESDRLNYIAKEMEFIEELLEEFDDCKWIYQALMDCRLLLAKVRGSISEQDREKVRNCLNELKKLDQLRKGRWIDVQQKLGI
jgi:geranylgeranyl transferase type-2 subunit alpha